MKITLVIFCLFALFLAGCIYEDFSHCPPAANISLVFRYNGDGEEDIFQSKIKNVYLYLFNENDVLYRIQEIPGWQLQKNQRVDLVLDKGTYHVVCWGNVFEHTSIQTTESDAPGFSSFQLFPPQLLTGEKVSTNDPLYFATHTLHVRENVHQTDTILFTSAHINMEIHIDGWETTNHPAEAMPSIEIENLFSMYDFKMVTTGGQMSYYPVVKLEGNKETTFSSATTVKRFAEENDVLIHVLNPNAETLFTIELRDFIRQNNIRIEGIQEVTIPIYIKFRGIDVSVSVQEWDDGGVVNPIV